MTTGRHPDAGRIVIIAEIGECWNGDRDQAERLIHAAADSGCDYVKFQTLDREGIAPDDPERDWFLKIALESDALARFRRCAMDASIGFLATPEKAAHALMLRDLGCTEVKVASSCLTDEGLLRVVNQSFTTAFVSTGLADLAEVDRAVAQLADVPNLYLLHCIAEYPTGPLLEQRGLEPLDERDVHLAMMGILADRFPRAQVGYSDHSAGVFAPVVAAAAGARVIEKHITLDRETPVRSFGVGPYMGTDHVLALEPHELREMVRLIRHVETMLGAPEWRRSEGELILRSFLRRRFHSEADTSRHP